MCGFSEAESLCRDDDLQLSQLFHSPMRMRPETFKSIAKTFSLPGAHLQMMSEASTVFADVQNISDGTCQDISSMSNQQVRIGGLSGHRLHDTEQLYWELAVQR